MVGPEYRIKIDDLQGNQIYYNLNEEKFDPSYFDTNNFKEVVIDYPEAYRPENLCIKWYGKYSPFMIAIIYWINGYHDGLKNLSLGAKVKIPHHSFFS